MSASTTPMTPATSVYTTPVFWERLWRGSGIHRLLSRVLLARSPATRTGW